ncbi:hypothetical protein [Kribbella sp. NPDC048928]|uniref:hypothetical protein n=1 Tax=Kribbella sp. NPDC048928 TaxID=3364111 RepID=UPI003721F9AE
MTVQTMQATRPTSPFVEPWRPTPRGTLITALVIALVVILSVVTVVVQRIWFTPESVITGYYRALADRDAEKALSFGRGSAPLDLLGSDKYVPPTNLKVGKIETGQDSDGKKSDDDRTAQLSFTIGDQQLTGRIDLHRSNQLSWGLFRGWDLSGDRPAITVNSSSPAKVQVNGQVVPPGDDGAARVEVFPGRYVVGIADNPLIEAEPVTVVAGFGDSSADLTPQIKADAKTAVDKQVKAYLNGCRTAALKPNNNCPFSVDSDVSHPVWRIDAFPTIALRIADDGQVVAESSTEGKATLTGVGYGGYPVNDPTSFRVSGLVNVEQGAIKFQPEE